MHAIYINLYNKGTSIKWAIWKSPKSAHIWEVLLYIQYFHDVLIDHKITFMNNQMKNFDNEYLNGIIMIEHKMDVDDLQMVDIEMATFFVTICALKPHSNTFFTE